MPGTFEHALNHLLDHEIDLSGFDARFHNDEIGASAFPPSMLLKVVLLAYSRDIVPSRSIERACREHITFVALSGDTRPHFTTIASSAGSSISTLHRRSVKRFPMAVTTPAARSVGSAAASSIMIVPEHIQPRRDRVKIA